MAVDPTVQIQDLPAISVEDVNSTNSPARGRALVAELSQRFRLPLQHTWVFWHDREEPKTHSRTRSSVSAAAAAATSPPSTDDNYAERLTKLHAISDVRQFWEVFNNFDVATLPMRDSVHLFKSGVKPLWEDVRNERGGSWTFRVPKDKVREFWQEVCMMAVGEKLQEAVATNRTKFNDDICGLSLSVRFTSTNISVWNRDADNAAGTKKLLETIIANLSKDLQPKNEQAYYYKKHFEHKDFKGANETDTAAPARRLRMQEIKFDSEATAKGLAGGLSASRHAPPEISVDPLDTST